MRKKYRITPEQTLELENALQQKEYTHAYRRIQTVMLKGQGLTVNEIMAVTKFSYSTVSELTKKYLEGGLAALLSDKRTSNNRYMTYEEEAAFLADYIKLSDQGQVATVSTMHQDYQQTVGKPTSKNAFYHLLRRHGWRKLMPRPQHPKKADAPTIEASKKLTQKSKQK